MWNSTFEPGLSDGWSGKKKKTYNNIFCKGQNTTVSKYIMERVSVGSVFFFFSFSIITAELAIFKLILKSISQKEWWNAWTIIEQHWNNFNEKTLQFVNKSACPYQSKLTGMFLGRITRYLTWNQKRSWETY